MPWNINFAKSNRGDEIVKESIKKLQKSTIGKVIHHIDLLQAQGPLLPMPYSKKITGNIYELRTRGRQEIRIFYAFIKNEIYLLHLFQKKTQKTPANEIKIANERFKGLT